MWRNLFLGHILKRGYEIDKNNIKNINLGNDITATILGSKEYNLLIANKFSYMECSCPCEGYYCKHLAALFLYLEDNYKDILNKLYDSNLLDEAIDNKIKNENNKLIREYDRIIKKYTVKINLLSGEKRQIKNFLNENIKENKKLESIINEQKLQIDNLNLKINNSNLKIKNLEKNLEDNLSKSKKVEKKLTLRLNYYIEKEEKEVAEKERQKQILDKKRSNKIKKTLDKEFAWINKLEEDYYNYHIVEENFIDNIYDELTFVREGSIVFDKETINGYFYYHMNTDVEYFYSPARDTYYTRKN